MGLRIATNLASEEVQKNLRKASEKSDDQLEKLSTGKRINKAADDPAGMAIASNLEAQTRGIRQAMRNGNDGISMIQTAEGGLSEISNIMMRLREITVQGASDTVGDNERGLLNNEYQLLIEEVDRISKSTLFNGISLIGGDSKGVLDFQVGAFAGEEHRIQYDSEATDASSGSLGISGTSVATKEDSLDTIATVDAAINTISGHRANIGAAQRRLQSTISNLEVQAINQDTARSAIEDVDVAESSSQLASQLLIKNAGVMTLAQANTLPSSMLRLIG